MINYTYDTANRISLIKDSANAVVQYLYVGQGRLSERKYMKATDGSTEVTTLHALYDGAGSITRFYHDKSDDSVVVGFQYGHDKLGNPQYKLREHQANYGDEYMYDRLYRLTRTVYDDSTPATPTVSPAAAVTDSFGYDSIGNRTSCYLKSATATGYLHNPVNEYTKESTGGTDKYYGSDAAGNLTRVAAASATDTDGDWRYYYDYENQMTKAEKREDGTWVTRGEYARDALMRRIEKVAAGTTIRYYHDGWRVIEETEGTATPTVERQYVFGNGIDEALVMFKKNGANYEPYYYLADCLWSVEAIVNDSAAIIEAYGYRAYGEPTIKTGNGGDGDWFDGDETTAAASANGNDILFAGRNYDPETELYYCRMRMYETKSGRFVSRDALLAFSPLNAYSYASNQPITVCDPTGLADYAIGEHKPVLTPDPAAGGDATWNTMTKTDQMRQLYENAKKGAAAFKATMPHTAAHFEYYLSANGAIGNEAKWYNFDAAQLVKEAKGAKDAYDKELKAAQDFALANLKEPGTYTISSTAITFVNKNSLKNSDWHFALGSFNVYGDGKVVVTQGAREGCLKYSMVFTFHVWDVYNFNTGQNISIDLPKEQGGGVVNIKATDLQLMHKQGFAREFIQTGAFAQDVSFEKAPKK